MNDVAPRPARDPATARRIVVHNLTACVSYLDAEGLLPPDHAQWLDSIGCARDRASIEARRDAVRADIADMGWLT